jgi:inosine-uridine nucleoside N-ribohydrolase
MALRRLAIGVLLALACLAATLALPVEVWRTGRLSVPPLTLSAPAGAPPVERLWIDTDAACGHTWRTDVDDCLAIWLLAGAPLEVAGVSTVFGNAPLDATDRVTRTLVQLLPWRGRPDPVVVYRGAPGTLTASASQATPARDALIRALEAGPLTVVALGPLTNIAGALQSRADLVPNVSRLVAVMGRRPGHLFHPSEGSGRGAFLGHGPVFRDFNFAADRDAVRALLAFRPPLTLIPYDAARAVEITSADLQALATHGGAGAWIAERSQGWLEYWRDDVGRSGFYPFDLMAAAYVRAPSLFRCAEVHAWVGADPLLFVPLFRPEALLVEGQEPGTESVAYCPGVQPAFQAQWRSWLSASAQEPS